MSRHSTIRATGWTANDLPNAPKSVKLEQRLSRVEVCCAKLQEQLKVYERHLVAVKAQLDHLMAKRNY
jgi:hypothetical protein